eukprot:m.40608 g.40608  ORF g.40608 m.40608 type:complete len:284 (-) comp6009_c0_seq2:191-1042(-)
MAAAADTVARAEGNSSEDGDYDSDDSYELSDLNQSIESQASGWSRDRLIDLEWYHPECSRHVAETLLLANGVDGSYLLRSNGDGELGHLALSVRCSDSVKHFLIERKGNSYKFGLRLFDTPTSFVKHFEHFPLLGGESGVLTLLRHPYPRKVKEPGKYDQLKTHAIQSTGRPASSDLESEPMFSVGSKEGFLQKCGNIRKNWKLRWFVLERLHLSYFRTREDRYPVRVLDLKDCEGAEADGQLRFRLAMPGRVYQIEAASVAERDQWLKLIQWKLEQLKTHSP